MRFGKLTGAVFGLMIGLAAESGVLANEVKIEDAKVSLGADGSYRFSVTLRHADNGWDHYADHWQVLSPNGDILATRVLMHPHETEQPFTRGMSGIVIPDGLSWVQIRAHDKVHGDGPDLFKVTLPGR